ncbi:MAG: helix-turn-helix domain-containing protein [Hyphomicrobiales bacterium]|nr:helix-turn-helix domain-containing protein [Hyphomicrobiales bacterium]
MGIVSMSTREFSRLDVLRDLDSGRITAAEAGQLLELGRSQVFNLLSQLRRHGPGSLVSKRRGRASNNRLPGAVRFHKMPARGGIHPISSCRSTDGSWENCDLKAFMILFLKIGTIEDLGHGSASREAD